MAKSNQQIIMKGQAKEQFLERIALAWKAKFPARARQYLKQLAETKDALYGASGMSKEGGIKYTAAIPVDIFWVINKKIPGFFRDSGNVRLFQKVFMGNHAPERTSGKFFYPGGPKK